LSRGSIPISLGAGCDVATEFLQRQILSEISHFFDFLWNLVSTTLFKYHTYVSAAFPSTRIEYWRSGAVQGTTILSLPLNVMVLAPSGANCTI